VAQTCRNARVQLELKRCERLITFVETTKTVSLFFMQIFYCTANCRAVRLPLLPWAVVGGQLVFSAP